jgi:hypothetical protein
VLVLSKASRAAICPGAEYGGFVDLLGCAVSWVIYTLLGRTVTGKIPAVAATAYSTWLGTAAPVAYAALQPPAAAPCEPEGLAGGGVSRSGRHDGGVSALSQRHRADRAESRVDLHQPGSGVRGRFRVRCSWARRWAAATLLGGAIVIVGVRLLNGLMGRSDRAVRVVGAGQIAGAGRRIG